MELGLDASILGCGPARGREALVQEDWGAGKCAYCIRCWHWTSYHWCCVLYAVLSRQQLLGVKHGHLRPGLQGWEGSSPQPSRCTKCSGGPQGVGK